MQVLSTYISAGPWRAGVAVIGYADKPDKAEALADAQAAAVTADLAEISTALRDTPCACDPPADP